MKQFVPNVSWLKSALPRKYADEISPGWCWPDIGEYYRTHDIPKEITEPIVRAIKDSGDGEACYQYCQYIENREDLVEVIRDSGAPWPCYLYCRYIENREELVEVIRDSGDAMVCLWYCQFVVNREDMADVLKESGNGHFCRMYCKYVRDREDLRKIADQVRVSNIRSPVNVY